MNSMKRILSSIIPQSVKNYLLHWPVSLLALHYYWFPGKNVKIIGVTGTDGKTTTVNLIYKILKESGLSVAMISTVSAIINDEEIDTGFHVTAPQPWLLQKLLKKISREKIEYLVLEVTSHGLDQFRLLGVNFEIGVLTNITHEHLDYHKTFVNYVKAKVKLFENCKYAVINIDDPSYENIKEIANKNKTKTVSYGLKSKADFTPVTFPFKTPLKGEYNKYNCLAAIATASLLKIDDKKIKTAIENFDSVVGRYEEINEGQNFRVIVDFAHTPNALNQILKTLREEIKGKSRLVTVFGAAGLRDREKRPMMGKLACQYSDMVILTAEDPRTEKVEVICQEIGAGCEKKDYDLKVIIDREKAIEYAIKEAKKDDIIVICGKGHEKSMCFGTVECPWSDQDTVRKILKERRPA